jgi:hypothetical protein
VSLIAHEEEEEEEGEEEAINMWAGSGKNHGMLEQAPAPEGAEDEEDISISFDEEEAGTGRSASREVVTSTHSSEEDVSISFDSG